MRFYLKLAAINHRFINHPIFQALSQLHTHLTKAIPSISVDAYLCVKITTLKDPLVINTPTIQDIEFQATDILRKSLKDLIGQPGYLI